MYSKANLVYYTYWIINNVHLKWKMKLQSKTKQIWYQNLLQCVSLFIILSKVLYPLHAELVWNSSLHMQIDLWLIHFANNTPFYNYCKWQVYQHGWSRGIILLLHICTENTECFCEFSCLTLILFLLSPLLNKRVYSPSAVSVFNISRRCFNWGVLEVSVITSCSR